MDIYTHHPGGILVHKHNTIKLDVVGEQPTTKYYPNQLKWLKSCRTIAPPQITVHLFRSFSNGMARTIWFSNRNFRFFHVNGKYPQSRKKDLRGEGGEEGGDEGGKTERARFVETQHKKHIKRRSRLRHVSMGAKFLDDNKPKIHLKSEFALFQTSSIFFNFI